MFVLVVAAGVLGLGLGLGAAPVSGLPVQADDVDDDWEPVDGEIDDEGFIPPDDDDADDADGASGPDASTDADAQAEDDDADEGSSEDGGPPEGAPGAAESWGRGDDDVSGEGDDSADRDDRDEPVGADPIELIDEANEEPQGGGQRSVWAWVFLLGAVVVAWAAVIAGRWVRGRGRGQTSPGELESGVLGALPPGPDPADDPVDEAAAGDLAGDLDEGGDDEDEDDEGAYVRGERRLDMALRAAAAGSGNSGLPPLQWVETAADSVVLAFQAPVAPPRGFTAVDDRVWRSSTSTGGLTRLAGKEAAPAPTLVPVGQVDSGGEILIELESSGVVTVDGADDDVMALLQALAVGVASVRWNDQVRLVLVGMSGALADHDGVVAVGSLADALALAEDHAARTATVLRDLAGPDTSHARAAGLHPESWAPMVVVSAVRPDDPADRRRLRDLAVLSHSGVAPVTPAPRGAVLPGRRVMVHDDGHLQIDGLGQPVWPRLLNVADADDWVGALHDDDVGGDIAPEEEPDAADTEDTDAAGPAIDRVDALLDEVEVLVRVLGSVEAVRLGPPVESPADNGQKSSGRAEETLVPSRPKSLEAITYLALREAPVDREALEIRLFPDGTNVPKTVYNTISGARNLLGEELFPAPENGRYELSDRVVTDYGLFCDLIAQADEIDDPPSAVALLTDALKLVSGEPFMGPGRNYAWVGPHRGMIVGHVVDAAEELGEIHLALSDWRAAEWAARQGLRAFPSDERLYRLLMRAAAAAGNMGGVRRVYAELCEVIADPDQDGPPEAALSPETVELYEKSTGASRVGSG